MGGFEEVGPGAVRAGRGISSSAGARRLNSSRTVSDRLVWEIMSFRSGVQRLEGGYKEPVEGSPRVFACLKGTADIKACDSEKA